MAVVRLLNLHRHVIPALGQPLFGFVMKAGITSVFLFLFVGIISGQTIERPADLNQLVISGNNEGTVFGVGRSLRIRGNVRHGAIAFGGDVIVEGVVEGDVAAIGGSVVQSTGARIGGDVIVLGGTYQHADPTPDRSSSSMTIMYAGYEEELRQLMRNPASILTPTWSSAYLGMRLLAVLFWFIVSLAVTAAMPGTVSRGVARLQLTSLRVAAIGLLGVFVIVVGVPFSLWLLPAPFSVLLGLMALMLLAIAVLFGRVIIYAATGRWLQRKYVPASKNSESVALLLGATFWIILSSLPYVWPLAVGVVSVLSLGLALTARYRANWSVRHV